MATLLVDDFVVKKDIYNLVADDADLLLFALAVMNSSLLSYLLQTCYMAANKNDFRQISLAALRSLPLPCMDKHDRRTVVSSVNAMLKARNSRTHDKLIDEVVFKAFGLTDREVEYVHDFLQRSG